MRPYSRLIVALSFFLSFMAANAVQALRVPRTFHQPDGTSITLTLVGDEIYSFYLTDDNRVALRGADGGYYYAEVDPVHGTPRPSDILVANGSSMSKAPALGGKSDAEALHEAIVKARNESPRMRRVEAATNAASRRRVESANSTVYSGKGLFSPSLRSFMTLTGSPRVLVILAEFSDFSFQTADAYGYFNGMLNTPGFAEYGATGSASDYFRDASGGQFTPVFDVYGPVTLPNTRKYYGEEIIDGDYRIFDRDDAQMIVDAMTMLDDSVDFSVYDNDGDGIIDNVFVIFAGLGQANSGDPDAIWPNSWDLGSAGKELTVDGKKVDTYGCSCEQTIIKDQVLPDGIGTFCHEFSHVLGLPDEYDVTYGEAFHDRITPGAYTIMDSGNYNNNGRTPPTYSLYQRNALGWANTTVISASSNRSMRLGNLIDTNNGVLLGLGSPYNEFFLFENRQKNPGTWDEYLPGHGMLVWHVNYDVSVWNSNSPNANAKMQRVDLIEACSDLDYNNNAIMKQYPFPGALGKTSITPATTPALANSDGEVLPISITEITENPFSGFITLVTNNGNGALIYAPTPSIGGVEVRTSPIHAQNGYNLEFTPVHASDVVNYIYRDVEGETISSGECDGSVHINAPGSIEYWSTNRGMESERSRIEFTFTTSDVVFAPAGGSFMAMPEVTMTSATTDPSAAIYYTTDGSEPTAADGILYEGPFTLEDECTVKAIAVVDGWESSNITEVTFLKVNSGIKVAKPVFTPEPGAVADKTCVKVSCDTEDAVIRYTIDGADPSEASEIFPADGLTLRKDTEILVRAFKDDCESSEVVSAAYTILPGNGSFKLLTDVDELAPGVQIIIAARDAEMAMSHTASTEGNPSILATAIEKLGKTVEPDEDVLVITLEASEVEGAYLLHADEDLYVAAISSSLNSLGFRTLDEAGLDAAASFEINNGSTSVVTQGANDRSNIRYDRRLGFVGCSAATTKPQIEVFYRKVLEMPTFSPGSGYIHAGDLITVTASVDGTVVRYTIDGAEPTEDSEIFPAEGMTIDEPITIKAKAYCDGYMASATATATYQIIDDQVAYRHLTDASILRDGDSVIITHIDGLKAMSTVGSDFNRKNTEIEKQGDSVIPNENVQILKLEAAKEVMEGTEMPQWRFNMGNDTYLYADKDDSNSIKAADLDTAGYNANATIEIEDGVATVTFRGPNSHNSLRVNGSGNFLCYAPTSTTSKVALYYRHAEPESDPDDLTGIEDVNVDTTSASAEYYTLQGIRVEHPAPGNVYIVVQGNSTAKRLIR